MELQDADAHGLCALLMEADRPKIHSEDDLNANMLAHTRFVTQSSGGKHGLDGLQDADAHGLYVLLLEADGPDMRSKDELASAYVCLLRCHPAADTAVQGWSPMSLSHIIGNLSLSQNNCLIHTCLHGCVGSSSYQGTSHARQTAVSLHLDPDCDCTAVLQQHVSWLQV